MRRRRRWRRRRRRRRIRFLVRTFLSILSKSSALPPNVPHSHRPTGFKEQLSIRVAAASVVSLQHPFGRTDCTCQFQLQQPVYQHPLPRRLPVNFLLRGSAPCNCLLYSACRFLSPTFSHSVSHSVYLSLSLSHPVFLSLSIGHWLSRYVSIILSQCFCLSVSLYLCISVSLSYSLSLSVFVYLSLSFLSLYLILFVSHSVYISFSLVLSFCVSLCLSLSLSLRLPMCFHPSLPSCLSVNHYVLPGCLSVCLSASLCSLLSVCPSSVSVCVLFGEERRRRSRCRKYRLLAF